MPDPGREDKNFDGASKKGPAFSYGHMERARWNVVDILEHLSKRANPAYLFDDWNVEESEELAKKLSDASGQKITITAILLKAISIAQLSHPGTAAFRTPFGYLFKRPTPVAGFTVERVVEDNPAVFFGVIREAHTKSLLEIAREISAYAQNDTDNVTQLWKETLMSKFPWILRQIFILLSLNIPASREILNPSTFGLTSLGKFGLSDVVAPNVTTTIFGIGSMQDKAVAINGKVEIRKMLSVSMSADLRAVTLIQASALMVDVKKLIETGLKGHINEDDMKLITPKVETKVLPFKRTA